MLSEQFIRLIAQQTGMISALSMQTIQMLLRLWQPFREWYDEDLVIAHAARSATTVESAQAQARRRQEAYLRFVSREMKITPPTMEAIRLEYPGSIDIYPRDASILDVWKRPAEQYRYAISEGLDEVEALGRAIDRIQHNAHMDLSLARREASRAVFEATPQITGYRRIIHPERSESGFSCGLCVVASTRIYSTDELLPIHNDCNCDVLPIIGTQDPGNTLNLEDLQTIYDAAGSNNAGDLLNTKVSFTEHGELGPIIANETVKGYEPGKKNRRKITKDERSTLQRTEDELKIIGESLLTLKRRIDQGEDDLRQAAQWQADRISELNRKLGELRRAS